MSTRVTTDLLKGKGVCGYGMAEFEKRAPEGFDMTKEGLECARGLGQEHIWWLYNKIERNPLLLDLVGVEESEAVQGGSALMRCHGAFSSHAVAHTDGALQAMGAYLSSHLVSARGICGSRYVTQSTGVTYSDCVVLSNAVTRSVGVERSNAISNSICVLSCNGVDHALFALPGTQSNTIFGTPVSAERAEEVRRELLRAMGTWRPRCNNIEALYRDAGEDWAKINPQEAMEITRHAAWADMPREAVEYVAGLPEFSAAVFAELTGVSV